MAAQVTEAIVFDCIGVLYTHDRLSFSGPKLNAELINFITKNLKLNFKIGLLSNIDRKWIDNFLFKNNLDEFFDAVVVSGDEGVAKPNEVIYQRMSESLRVKPDVCLMVDDLLENCVGAEKAGMRSIHFISNNELFEKLVKLELIS